jgi:hypothetical protein
VQSEMSSATNEQRVLSSLNAFVVHALGNSVDPVALQARREAVPRICLRPDYMM